jgi:hypothetical protein
MTAGRLAENLISSGAGLIAYRGVQRGKAGRQVFRCSAARPDAIGALSGDVIVTGRGSPLGTGEPQGEQHGDIRCMMAGMANAGERRLTSENDHTWIEPGRVRRALRRSPCRHRSDQAVRFWLISTAAWRFSTPSLASTAET